MTESLETLVIAAYVFADSLSIPRSGPAGKATDSELIALSVAQAVLGISSDRQFLGVVKRLLPGWFGDLPGQSQFNRRLRRLTPQMTTVRMMLAELVAEGRVRLVDGTLISCANYPGCASRSHFAGQAPPRRAPLGGGRQGPHPPGNRVGLLDPQAPDAIGDAPGQDGCRARSTDRPATTGAHPRGLCEHPSRPSTTGTCPIRWAVNPHQASRVSSMATFALDRAYGRKPCAKALLL